MPAENHVHSYVRVDGMKERYMCYAPTCSHHIDRKFIINKLSACPDCGNVFTLDRNDLRLKVPKCINCRNTKEGRAYRAAQLTIKETVDKLFTETPVESAVDEFGNMKPISLTFEDIMGTVEEVEEGEDSEDEDDEEFELEGDNLHG